MTRLDRFRLLLSHFNRALHAAMPHRAMAFVPALVTLVAYALALPFMRDAEGAFVVAFITGYGAHSWLRLPGLIKGEAVALFGAESAVIVPLVLVSVMVAIGDPIGCLRVFSVFAGVRALLFADDLWNQRFDYAQHLWPNALYRPSDALISQVFLCWSLVQIVLIEVIIAAGNLALWLAFAALANILIGTVNRILETMVVLQTTDVRAP